MDVANQVAEVINSGFDYLRNNAWAMLFLLGVGYVVKTKVLDVYFTGAPNNTPGRVKSLQEDMRLVRMKQQEEAQKRAQEYAKEHKEKEREKKHKKNLAASATSLKKNDGDNLGGTSSRSSGYNPMNPSSGATCGYRPGRKGPSARRG